MFKEESGFEVVRDIIKESGYGRARVYIHKLNLLEVFYGFRKADGLIEAESIYNVVMRMPVVIISEISNEVFLESSRIKTVYKMSLADSIALAEASVKGALLVTSDHHEFDPVEKAENIKFLWIR
jgi:predicted nucleic acid-binding protein